MAGGQAPQPGDRGAWEAGESGALKPLSHSFLSGVDIGFGGGGGTGGVRRV